MNELHLLHLVLFHDLAEARTGDFNYVYHKYDRVNEDKLYADLEKELPFGEEIVTLAREFEANLKPEARLANDADQLEFLLILKEQQDLGNPMVADRITRPWRASKLPPVNGWPRRFWRHAPRTAAAEVTRAFASIMHSTSST